MAYLNPEKNIRKTGSPTKANSDNKGILLRLHAQLTDYANQNVVYIILAKTQQLVNSA